MLKTSRIIIGVYVKTLYGVIYKATNKISGKSYIGQTIQSLSKRKSNHVMDAELYRDNMYFHKAIRKYGRNNFEWEILFECYTIDELNKKEIHFIEKYKTFTDGYNLTIGGEGVPGRSGELAAMYGKKHTDESKRKIGNAHKGLRHSKEAKIKMSKAKKGKKLSESHKRNLRNIQRGKDNIRSKKFIITRPDGKETIAHGLIEFCRNYTEDKLNYKCLSACATGKQKQHKGYKCRYL